MHLALNSYTVEFTSINTLQFDSILNNSAFKINSYDMDPTFLFKEGELTYRILTKEYRDQAQVVLARAFCSEPCTVAAPEVDPKMKTSFLEWFEFAEYWMDHCSTNGLSVYAIDEKAHRIAGAFIVRHAQFMPPGFLETFSTDEKTLTPWLQFVWHLDTAASKIKPEVANLDKVADFWWLGVHPDYRGNKIANHLTRALLPLVKKAGFKYATIEATSAFTSSVARFNNFEAIVSMDVKDWVWKGKRLYTEVKPPHGTWTFWVKDLDTI